MKKLTYILIFSLSGVLHGQAAFHDVERLDSWVHTVVSEVTFTSSVEVVPGVIYVMAEKGDILGIWNSSGVSVHELTVQEDGEVELRTDYLMHGQYYLGVKKQDMEPVVKGIEIIKSDDQKTLAMF